MKGQRTGSVNSSGAPGCASGRSTGAGAPSIDLKTTGQKQAGGATQFRPGVSGNPRGRPGGARNKATQQIQELAGPLLDDEQYQANLLERLRAGTAGPMEPLLWRYRFGAPPRETLDLGTA